MFDINLSEDEAAIDIALSFYDEGYNVVPLQRSNKKPPPFLKGWEQYKNERPSRETVHEWFVNKDNLVVALVCGKFMVVDADSPEERIKKYKESFSQSSPAPETDPDGNMIYPDDPK